MLDDEHFEDLNDETMTKLDEIDTLLAQAQSGASSQAEVAALLKRFSKANQDLAKLIDPQTPLPEQRPSTDQRKIIKTLAEIGALVESLTAQV